jgi:hypothetical protein
LAEGGKSVACRLPVIIFAAPVWQKNSLRFFALHILGDQTVLYDTVVVDFPACAHSSVFWLQGQTGWFSGRYAIAT